MNADNQKTRTEIANEIFHGIPTQDKRQKMSAEELAILLSESKEGKPVYILIHECPIKSQIKLAV